MFIACTIIASTLQLAAVVPAGSRTVQAYDNQRQLSHNVLNRTICDVIPLLHPEKTRDQFVSDEQYSLYKTHLVNQRKAQRDSWVTHCKRRLRSEGLLESECELAK